jgi:hypothetical protein
VIDELCGKPNAVAKSKSFDDAITMVEPYKALIQKIVGRGSGGASKEAVYYCSWLLIHVHQDSARHQVHKSP